MARRPPAITRVVAKNGHSTAVRRVMLGGAVPPVPVYITNKNRLTPLRKLISWLLGDSQGEAGRITVLDNGSTYPPLFDYYKEMADKLDVVHLAPSGSLSQVFWDLGMHKTQPKPYIVTDSDVFPSESCPGNLIARMAFILEKYKHRGICKVGPGLRLDNLPESPWRSEVLRSQAQYWRHPVNHECYSAGIATTFALYNGDFGGQSSHALRLETPYLFEHYPWYVWPLNEEERYYARHDSYTGGHSNFLKTHGLVLEQKKGAA